MNIYIKYLISALICLGIGFAGTFFTMSEIPTWYASLNKPFFSPPNWIFGPVWTTLYILMGISVVMALEHAPKKKHVLIIGLFGLQLFLNLLWSAIFFGSHELLLAFMEIIFLWINILALILIFRKYSRVAAWLLVPYLGWVSFASLLNLSVFFLNK